MVAIDRSFHGQPRRLTDRASKRVLVIDDYADGRESLRMVLDVFGHEVAVAPDGETGIQKAVLWKPDAAVIDIALPNMDGYEVARRLRKTFEHSILLIAFTVYCQPDDERKAYAAGFDHFVSKPTNPEQILRLIART
jgi:CheY-like chemotaxis protein